MADNRLAALVEQIVLRRCVLFVGPDSAEPAYGYLGLPTSWQLADELAAASAYRGGYRPLPQIAQIFQHRQGRHELVQYLRQRLDAPLYKPLPIHELIARIPFPVIVYSGWDNLLEQALQGQGIRYRAIQSAYDIPYALPADELVLYKPFGSLDRPDSLVITEDDQHGVLYELRSVRRRLTDLIAAHALLLVGYAPDFDSVFVRIYYEIRQELGEHRNPAFVIESLSRPQDAAQWEARGIRPLVAEPGQLLYELAAAVAAAEGRDLALPPLESLSQAPRLTPAELASQTETMNRILDTLGVADLVEQTDVPLLDARQLRDLEDMRAAYTRLAAHLEPLPGAARVWLRQGNIEYTRQNFEQARRFYEQALAAEPGLAEAHHNLHYVFLAQDDLAASLAAYQQAIALQPDLAMLPSRYAITAVLGRGGTGVVYQAQDQESGEMVAVKILDRAFTYTEEVLRRFRREGEILLRLQHPHIVRCLDVQQYQGRYYIVMEYLGERNLAGRLAEEGALPLDDAFALFSQVAEAVEYAHGQGVIHRDLKPANVFLAVGQAKLIDFGLAVDLQAGQPTVSGQASGAIAYMAPEQIAGQPVDERTDIYALGTVLYEMLANRHPGQGAYQPLSRLVQGLDDALDIVVDRARARQPADRYPTVAAFVQELAGVIPWQAASRQAPAWLRGLMRLQRALAQAASRYWYLALLAVLLAGLGPGWLGWQQAVRPGWLLAFVLWDAFLLILLADWYTAWLAQRNGQPFVNLFAPLLGLVLGAGIAVLTLFAWMDDVDNFVVGLLFQGMAAVAVGAVALLALGSAAGWLQRRLGNRGSAFAGYAAALLVLLSYALALFISGQINLSPP